MDVIEAKQLISLDVAQQLSGVARRTFQQRLKEHNVAIFIDPIDRRKRLVVRSDVEKLARPAERSSEPTAA